MRIELYMACPVCITEGYNSSREYWKHNGPCQGVLCLDEYANIICKKCRRSEHLTKMKLKCGNNRHNFVVPSVEGFAMAISTSAQLVNQAGIAWLTSAIEHLG